MFDRKQLIKQGNFTGAEYKLSLNIVPDLYFVRYNDGNGQAKFVKMIKL